MGKLKLYRQLLTLQVKNRFKKAKEFDVPKCGLSFTKLSKLADEVNGVTMVEGQETKGKTVKIMAKTPEITFSFVSKMGETIVENMKSPSKKDKANMKEMADYLKKLEPTMKDFKLMQDAQSLIK